GRNSGFAQSRDARRPAPRRLRAPALPTRWLGPPPRRSRVASRAALSEQAWPDLAALLTSKGAVLARNRGIDMGCPDPPCQAERLHDPASPPIFPPLSDHQR